MTTDRDLIAPSSSVRRLPTSPAQNSMWRWERMARKNLQLMRACRLPIIVDQDALFKACQYVVQRHEALRTTIRRVDGTLWQVVDFHAGPDFRIADVSELSETDRDTEVRRLGEEFASNTAGLDVPPPVRVLSISFSQEASILIIIVQHTVTDRWSQRIVFSELDAAYAAILHGQEPILPAPAQFGEYVIEQLKSTVVLSDRVLPFWRNALNGVQLPRLPTDYVQPQKGTYRADAEVLSIRSDKLYCLKQTARGGSATLYMVILAIIEAALFRWSGETDLVIGTLMADRGRREFASIVGLLLLEAPTRVNLAGDPTFLDLVKRVKRVVTSIQLNFGLPYEAIAEQTDLGGRLCNTLLNFASDLSGLVAGHDRQPSLFRGATDFPLSPPGMEIEREIIFQIYVESESVTLFIAYSIDHFKKDTIGRLIRYIISFTDLATTRSNCRLSNVPEISIT